MLLISLKKYFWKLIATSFLLPVWNQCMSLTNQFVWILEFCELWSVSFLMTNKTEDFCNEELIYFYYLNLELIC